MSWPGFVIWGSACNMSIVLSCRCEALRSLPSPPHHLALSMRLPAPCAHDERTVPLTVLPVALKR